MNIWRLRGTLLVLLAGLLLLSACADGTDSDSAGEEADIATDDAEPEVAAEPTAEETAAAAETTEPAEEPADESAEDPASDEELTIGLAQQGSSRSFVVSVGEGAQRAADELGVELLVTDSQDDSAKQANDIQDLLAQEIDGLIVSPIDAGIAEQFVRDANDADVPILAVSNQIGPPEERDIDDVYPGTVALVTQDEVAAGEKAASIVADSDIDTSDAIQIAVLQGRAGTPSVPLRQGGFTTGLDDAGVSYEIAAEQPGDWTQEGGEAACQNMLTANPETDLIYSMSDEMSIGCARAIESANVDVPLVSVGGSVEGIKLLEDDRMFGTVCYKPEDMGALAVEVMVKHLRGEQTYDAEFVTYETPAITRDNIDQCQPAQW